MPKNTKFKSPFATKDVLGQLDLILASPDFKATPQQIALLKYVVKQKLAGNEKQIKGFKVAIEVFGRGSDFEQNTDPIVSIQAARLRRAMTHYYQGDGRHDEIRITIPKGTYVPVFAERPRARETESAIGGLKAAIRPPSHWPSVLVRPVRNLSDDSALDFWGIGVASEIANELSRYPDIRVMTFGTNTPETAANRSRVQFALDGSIRSDGTGIKVILKLADTWTGRQIWSHSYRASAETAKLIAFQEDIARETAVKVAGYRGGIARILDRASKRRSLPYSQVYEAVLRYYEYELTATPQAFRQALAALEEAVALDPECGQVWTMRSRLFADIHALDIPGFDQPLENANKFALNGLRLRPSDQRSHSVMAFIHLLHDDLQAGRAEAEQALQLGPETLFVLDGIGAMMTLLGDWERGPVLIEKAIRLNLFYNDHARYALWINWLRQKDYDRAYQDTKALSRPAHIWDHLAKAATSGLRGDIENGRKAAAELLESKHDFPEHGRKLIGHLVKFENIREQIVEGLAAVGVRLA